jgi:gamma-glutamylaminecyclotransferase
MPGTVTLFVYGTLKRGCRNHGTMRGAVFIGEAATEHAYLMVNCGSYPGLVRAWNKQAGISIRGELYRVDEELLAALDRFEDVPYEYVRVTIRLADGSEAETYFYALPFSGLKLCGAEWAE